MSEFDHDHHIKLVIDEWGHGTARQRANPATFSNKPNSRDALFSAMS